MSSRNKKILARFLLFFSILIIGWFILVEVGVRKVEMALETASSDLRKKGFTISYSKVEFKGNPLSIQAIFYDPHFKDPQGLFDWSGQGVQVTTKPWDLKRLKVIFSGDQKVSVPQNFPFPLGILKLEDSKGEIKLTSRGELKSISFSCSHVFTFLGQKRQPLYLKETFFKIENLSQPLAASLSFSTHAKGLEAFLNLPPLDHPLILSFEAHLSGYKNQEDFPNTLSQWRDGGGVIDIKALKLSWLPFIAQAQGTLTLDKDMYPLGSFSSQMEGYQEVLNYLVELKLLKKKKARAASFVLDLLSVPDQFGTKHLTVPITLQNKRFSVGPAPLFKLKPVANIF